MGGKQTVHMKSKGYGGPIVGSPVMGAPLVGFPAEPMMETTVVHPPMMAGPMVPPPLPAGYTETMTTYPAMGMAPTMGAVMPNNNRWKVTMKSRGNQPPVGLPAGTVAPYYSGNERFDYKVRQRSGGLFSRGPKSTVHIKERNRGAGGYYGGSVMPGYSTTTIAGPIGAPMAPMYEEEVVQQYPYAAGAYGAGPYGAGPYGG